MNRLTLTTILIILILVSGSITATSLSQNIFAVSSTKKVTGVEVSNIKTIPKVIHKQNNFKINATVINNSPNTIKFIKSACDEVSPLSASFNKNVNTHPSGIAIKCTSPLQLVTLHSGEKTTVRGPNVHTTYTAIGTGKTIANVSFHYTEEIGNKNNSVSTSFVFVILK